MDEVETVAKRDSEQDTAHPDPALIEAFHGGRPAPLFVPGQSGNPRGRPTDAERLVSKMLRQHPESLAKAADAWAAVLADPTNRHWAVALREAMDRTEGPVASQAHHHVSTDRAVVVHPQTAHAPMLPHAGSGQAAQALPAQRAPGASVGGQGGGEASVPDPAACVEGAPTDPVEADPERLGDPIRDASYDDDASGPAAPESAP